jgi:hypothetical protein
LERCAVAALAEAHKVIDRAKAKTDRIVFAPFNLPIEPIPRKDRLLGPSWNPTSAAVLQTDHVRTVATAPSP